MRKVNFLAIEAQISKAKNNIKKEDTWQVQDNDTSNIGLSREYWCNISDVVKVNFLAIEVQQGKFAKNKRQK